MLDGDFLPVCSLHAEDMAALQVLIGQERNDKLGLVLMRNLSG